MGRRVCISYFGLVALGVAALTSPVAAKDPLVLAPSSEWQFRKYDDRCRASRDFGEGENRTTLWLEQGGEEANYNITLLGRPLRKPHGGGVHLKFGDEPEIVRSYISSESSNGRPVLIMYGVSISQPQLDRDGNAPAPDTALDRSRVSAIDTLKLRTSIVEPFEMELGSMTGPYDFLNLCGKELAMKLSAASQVLSSVETPPQPIKVDRWLSEKDYPRYLVASQMAGEVTARITVTRSGNPGSCFILGTNKPNLFNDLVCLALMQRAKFEPARDLEGKPVASYYFYSVQFQIK